jgi:DNA repair exonuclease SbcCD ATPase subunit
VKIVSLQAENIKRLVAVDIRPDGNLVEITGKNGQGKTSILDAIWWALDSNKVVQSSPIREGAEKGFVELDLGDYIVTKTFKRKPDGDVTIALTVKNKDGFKADSPVKLLETFIGDLTFDPLAFARMKPQDQVVALRALVKDYDFADADTKNKADFEARTEVNRTVRDLKARIEAIIVPEDTPDQRISAESLMGELSSAMDHNSKIDAARTKRVNIDQRIGSIEAVIADRKQQIKTLQAAIIADELAIEELRDEADGIDTSGEKLDIESIRQQITKAEETNRYVDRKQQRATLQSELKAAEEKSAAYTKTIDDRKEAASSAVRRAELPVGGLELTDDAILVNGQPFDQASDAEQLRVSVAVAGAMNPKLRVIRVRDGSLLDTDSMKLLSTYAEEHDMQIWLESVQSPRETAIVIEDGRVAGAQLEAAE